jgi:hypothetical protein
VAGLDAYDLVHLLQAGIAVRDEQDGAAFG